MIMHGLPQNPGGNYGVAIEIMMHMHWNWRDLLDAPANLVEEIAFRLSQENKWTNEKRKLDAAMQ